MPIDSSIAMSGKPVDIQNPLTAYTNYLQASGLQNQNALHQFQFEQAQRADTVAQNRMNALQEAGTDAGKIGTALINSGDVKGYSEFKKSMQEAAAKQQEELAKQVENSRALLSYIDPNAPDAAERMKGWHEWNHKQSLLGPSLAAQGVKTGSGFSTIDQAAQEPGGLAKLHAMMSMGAAKFAEANAPKYLQTDQGGVHSITAYPGLGFGQPAVAGALPQTPLPPDVEAQKIRIAAAGAARNQIGIDMKAEGEYKKTVAKSGADADTALYETAQTAKRDVARLDHTLSVLRTQDLNTGIGADFFNTMDKLRSKFAADQVAGKRVENTEYLKSMLGSSVFGQLQAMGLTSKNIDTPAERDFLLGVISGTIDLNKDTLIRMADLRREQLVNASDEFNRRVDSGEMAPFFDSRQRRPERIVLPPAAQPAVSASAVKPAAPRRVEIPPMNTQPAAQASQQPVSQPSEVRRGRYPDGRVVIQYSDGSIRYAD